MKRYLVLVLVCTMIIGNLAIPTSANTTPDVVYHYNYDFESGVLPAPDWTPVPALEEGVAPTWDNVTIVGNQTTYETGKVAKVDSVGFIPVRSNRIMRDGNHPVDSDLYYSIIEFDLMFDENATEGNVNLLFMQRAFYDEEHNAIAKITFDADSRTLVAHAKNEASQQATTNILLENVQPNSWHRIKLEIQASNYKRVSFYADGERKGDSLYRFLGGNESKMSVLDTIKVTGSNSQNSVYIDNLVFHKVAHTNDSNYIRLLNKGALVKTIRDVENVIEENYEESSFQGFEEKLNLAKAAYEDYNSGTSTGNPGLKSEQSEIDTRNAELKAAFENLVPYVADKTPLLAAIDAAIAKYENEIGGNIGNGLNQYSQYHVDRFLQSISAAQAVAEKQNPTYVEIITTVENLEDAMELIQPNPEVVDKTELNSAIDLAEQKYSEISSQIGDEVGQYHESVVLALRADIDIAIEVRDRDQNGGYSSPSEIREAAEVLLQKLDEIKPNLPADKTALINKINQAVQKLNSIKQEDIGNDLGQYNPTTVAVLEDAIANAQNIARDDNVSQRIADLAVQNLDNAIKNLVLVDGKVHLWHDFESGLPLELATSKIGQSDAYKTGRVAEMANERILFEPVQTHDTITRVGDIDKVTATVINVEGKNRALTISYDVMFSNYPRGEVEICLQESTNTDYTFLTRIIFNRSNSGKLEAAVADTNRSTARGYPGGFVPLLDQVETGRWYRVRIDLLLSSETGTLASLNFYVDGEQKKGENHAGNGNFLYTSGTNSKVDRLDSILFRNAVGNVKIDNLLVYKNMITETVASPLSYTLSYINKDGLISNIRQGEGKLKNADIGMGENQYGQEAMENLSASLDRAKQVFEYDSATQAEIDLANSELMQALKNFAPWGKLVQPSGDYIFKNEMGDIISDFSTLPKSVSLSVPVRHSGQHDEAGSISATLVLYVYNQDLDCYEVKEMASSGVVTLNSKETGVLEATINTEAYNDYSADEKFVRVFLWDNYNEANPIFTVKQLFN